MYVCVCKGVTCSQIRQAVCSRGACRMRDLARELGVATQCGRCASCAKGVLEESLSQTRDASLSVAPAGQPGMAVPA